MGGDPQLWGGFECSVVRVGGVYRDQFRETGHDRRPEDIKAAADLGVKALRYPILWESISPDRIDERHWQWHDARLRTIREAGLAVIAGFSHHGSGPRYTHLLDPKFADLMSRHADAVARRYPWIADFTPVNEPLTTARFSCLYGHWFPHERSEAAFLRALVIQIEATVLAMRAVRTVTPNARLIQTEDLGRVFGPPSLANQVDYENERRWLSFDLLTGKVDRHHPFYSRFLRSGIGDDQLRRLAAEPCVPDVFGINHYLTSDRYLDDDTAGYPPGCIGGNGHQTYADVAAVRVPGLEGQTGFEARLREAWARYGRPLALTEVHNGCTREEQIRWLAEAWTGAQRLRSEGIPVEGFTVWSLAGAVDWTSMLTQQRGDYETGVFDIRSGKPRPTGLAGAVRKLSGSTLDHPVLDGLGWWQRPDRLHKPVERPVVRAACTRPILITGKTGTLGQAFSRICEQRDLGHVLLGRGDLDIADEESVRQALENHRPWAIINAAGFVRVAEAGRMKQQCFRENAAGAQILARAAAHMQIPLVTFSSDLVFDGKAGRAYHEGDPPSPQCVYGLSKAMAERDVLACHDRALVVRTSAFFGPWDRYNFAWSVLSAVAAGHTFDADADAVVSPTYVPDLVNAALDLLIDEACGLWHLSNEGQLAWSDFARMVAGAGGFKQGLVRACSSGRTINTALGTEKGIELPGLDHAVQRFLCEVR